jgi:CubicO group peptidase (beta-lactamase class C family)
MATLRPDGLERFAQVANDHVRPDRVPGLVALLARGDEVVVHALGRLSLDGPPVARDSLFRIASTTKPVTAVAALSLVTDGTLGLDEPVGGLLPELAHPRVLRRMDGPLEDTVPAEGPVTVRHLLTFTMGFGMSAAMFMAPEPWPVVAAATERPLGTLSAPQPERQPDPDTWMATLAELPLMDHPGRRWLYNTSASVLGVLVARAAGRPLADVLAERVFKPAAMRDTAFFAADPSRLATAYTPTPDRLEVFDPPEGQWSRPPAFGDGAAGLVSTADDLLALARLLLGGGAPVLSRSLVAQMTSDQLSEEQRTRDTPGFLDGRSWGFGQSVVVDGPRAGAFGWDGGLGTSWLVDPGRDVVVIVLTQRLFETALAPAVHTDLQDAAYAAVGPD